MRKNRSTAVIISGAILLAAFLFLWGKFADPNRATIKNWQAIGVRCLPQGHVNLAQHIHPSLTIIMDGQTIAASAEIGAVKTCMSEMHTHDLGGTIHIESVESSKTFTLGQFFQIWGEPLEKAGYALSVKANGQTVENPKDLILKDLQKIVVEYTK